MLPVRATRAKISRSLMAVTGLCLRELARVAVDDRFLSGSCSGLVTLCRRLMNSAQVSCVFVENAVSAPSHAVAKAWRGMFRGSMPGAVGSCASVPRH